MERNAATAAEDRLLSLPNFGLYFAERSPQPVVAVEGARHIVRYINSAFTNLVGKPESEILGRPFAEAVLEGPKNGSAALLDRVFRSGTSENLAEQPHRQTRPPPVYWSYAAWAIVGADELPAGVMIQITDATEIAIYRQQAAAMNEALLISSTRQHELAVAAERLTLQLEAAVKARDRFVATLAHELRNPLSPLKSGLQLLRMAPADAATVERSGAMMERQLAQLVRLVDDLLDINRVTTGKLNLRKERIDLRSVVQAAVESSLPIIDRGHHEITLTQPPESITLEADPARLAQVFINLLSNAAKYTEPGGKIRLTVEREGSYAVVRIQDSGIGIRAAQLSQIFDIFVQVDTAWQRAQGGLGIGLSLVNEMVTLHGGQVEARSAGLGKGSEFIVRLPTVDGHVQEQSAAGAEVPAEPRRRVLVVDDNKDAAESLATLLTMMGHDVQTAHDGEAAVAAASEFRPEMVLMDLGMPRVSGYDAARRIRAEPWGNEQFLVALTGWGAESDRRRTHEAGFDKHLVKPVGPGALAKLFAEIPTGPPLIPLEPCLGGA